MEVCWMERGAGVVKGGGEGSGEGSGRGGGGWRD